MAIQEGDGRDGIFSNINADTGCKKRAAKTISRSNRLANQLWLLVEVGALGFRDQTIGHRTFMPKEETQRNASESEDSYSSSSDNNSNSFSSSDSE